MGFQSGLSGLNTSTKNLDVIGNNIANAQTVGMKASRAEFSALVSSALGAGDQAGNGIGVSIAAVTQQFSQGNISITGNNLDVAINGTGFFQLQLEDKSVAYSRDGQFKLDNTGQIISNNGAHLLGFPLNAETGSPTSVTPVPLSVPTGSPLPAKTTTAISARFNLPAKAAIAATVVPPTPITKYGTSINAFDSQGLEAPASLYFVKIGPNPALVADSEVKVDTWDVFDATTLATGEAVLAADATVAAKNKTNYDLNIKNTEFNTLNEVAITAGTVKAKPTFTTAAPDPGTLDPLEPLPSSTRAVEPNTFATGAKYRLTFDASGKLDKIYAVDDNGEPAETTAPTLLLKSTNPAIPDFSPTLDIKEATQYGTAFSITELTQDGYTAGELTGINISEDGKITTVFSNGQAQIVSQLSMADFRNVQGLTPIGSGNWMETARSGQPIQGAPGEGKFGKLRSGALEESNVDLTAELVNMMTAQRSYQANVQTIKTQDQALQALVNLR
ncbi:MAG: flagellar hook protein FlgE [Rhodoferax sp.]|nr:flagellar hook protein FlgE [Rhodoferax sp.]MCF8208396.1 flagellar hook protein FlgE [Rhodoferax sp.]